jgi:hypothetical protein
MVANYALDNHFARIHHRPRITPGMAAGPSDQVSSVEEIALKANHQMRETRQAWPYRKRIA